MKNVFIISILFFSGMLVKAQDIFFPTKVGIVLEYKVFDKNEKETGMIRYTITDVKQLGENMDITYRIETMDAKEEPLFNEEITIHKKETTYL